jgi:metal-responsive CopG/Arc/MetJ family transcriptional regulator
MARITLSLPDDLLKRIDEEARRRSISRSALIAIAARHEVSERDPDALAEAIVRSEARFREAGAFEASDLVRQTRDGAHS